jgi:hypothetical protein
MQMLGPKGNPTIRNFFEIVSYLQEVEGSALQVIDVPAPRRGGQHPGKSKRRAYNSPAARNQAA